MKRNWPPRSEPPGHGGLWQLTAGPTAWALHFLLCYATVAIHCAKAAEGAPLGGVRIALWIYTLLALAVIAAFGWRGWRAHRMGGGSLPNDAGTAAERGRFLGFVTLLLCALAAAAVSYTAFAIVVIGTCR